MIKILSNVIIFILTNLALRVGFDKYIMTGHAEQMAPEWFSRFESARIFFGYDDLEEFTGLTMLLLNIIITLILYMIIASIMKKRQARR